MKTAVKIILVAALAMLSYVANAQIYVNKIRTYTEMTKADVIEMFGEPTKYESYTDKYDTRFEKYYYGESFLVVIENHFDQFQICDDKFMLTVETYDFKLEYRNSKTGIADPINVTVGDKFSKLDPASTEYMDWFGKDWYCIYVMEQEVRFLVKDGIIKCITHKGA